MRGDNFQPSAAVPEWDLPILMFHIVHPVTSPAHSRTITISLATFVEQLNILTHKGFQTITFARLLSALRGETSLPRRPIILTFDDGYASFHQHVLPQLLVRKMVASVFLVGEELGGVNRWDAHGITPTLQLLNDFQIRELVSEGIEIGAHGWAHRNLRVCSEREAREEIIRTKECFRDRLGIEVAVYSYPYGAFAPRHFPILSEAGYQAAAAISTGYRHVTTELFALRRLGFHEGDRGWRLQLKLSRLYLRYSAMRERRRLGAAL